MWCHISKFQKNDDDDEVEENEKNIVKAYN